MQVDCAQSSLLGQLPETPLAAWSSSRRRSKSVAAFRLVGVGLEQATRMGFKRIVVFRYFWFSGILIERIHTISDILWRSSQLRDGLLSGNVLVERL